MAETLQERQSNELEALKAIFNDQLKDNNESETKDIWKPLDITITVLPEGITNFEQNNILVDLHVKASENYPNEIPLLQLKNAKGVSSNYLMHLEKQLNELASKIIGEVMIFELVQYIQNYLFICNKPQYASIYEEMISRKIRKEVEETELKKQQVELTKQLIHDEISKKKEALKIELRMHKNSITKNTFETLINEEDEEEKNNLIEISNSPNRRNAQKKDQMDKINYDNFILDYNLSSFRSRLNKEFDILSWLGKGAFGDVFKVKNKLDGCLYAIKCIKLNKNNTILNKKITREVKLLSRLNHENVVRYFNSWIEAISQEETPQINKKNQTNEKFPVKDISCTWKLSNLVEELNSESSSDEEESDWIQFIHQSNSDKVISENTFNDNSSHEEDKVNINIDQFMYIQMEFCEKSTLRNAVDNGLYQEPPRVWRLLREIVEGLSYIHQQGIIHRDLKPGNIFIDFEDHVKIGDFGLATNIIQRHITDIDVNIIQDVFIDSSQTTNIGTTLYVAPELNILSPKAVYNEKVDIYSLGIIFFEMCHKPFSTDMERIKVLSELRLYECILPTEFLKTANLAQKHIIKWLLNHDPCKRPNSTDILQSQFIPPPKLKDTELHEMVKYAFSNSKSKNYKHIIASCFKQTITTVEDITFTMSTGKNILYYDRLNTIIDIVKSIFQIHGGIWLCTPILMPALNSVINESTVNLMNCWGGLICLPYNLRIPFARFLAYNPTISNIKRYTIDRVYRQRRVYGVHPRELYEAAFDIVSPAQDMIAEAELLSIAAEIFQKLKDFNHKNCIIRLNHVSLIQGILMYAGIEKARHLEICGYFAKFKKKDLSQEQIEELVRLGFANHQVNLAMNFFSMEYTLADMIEKFRKITVRKSKCGIFSREGLFHLETVIKHINSLNVKFSVVIAPGLMNIMQYFSGLIFEIVYKTNKKNLTEYEVLSAGGRYDKLISSFRRNLDSSNDTLQTAIGISFSLDKLAVLFQTELSRIDVILCSSSNTMKEEKLNIAKDLWTMGVKTLVLDEEQTLEQIQNYCQELCVTNIIMLKETKSIILRHLMGDRFQDKSMSVTEFIESMKNKNIQNSIIDIIPQTNSSVKNDSRSTFDNQYINIMFFTEDRLITNVKRRYEGQILNTVSKTLQKLSSKIRVEILVLNVHTELIKSLSLIDIQTIESDISVLIKRYSCHKKDLNKLYNYIVNLKHKNEDIVFVFYTLKGNTFKLFFL